MLCHQTKSNLKTNKWFVKRDDNLLIAWLRVSPNTFNSSIRSIHTRSASICGASDYFLISFTWMHEIAFFQLFVSLSSRPGLVVFPSTKGKRIASHSAQYNIAFKAKKRSIRFVCCWWRMSFRSFFVPVRNKNFLRVADSSNISFFNNWIKLGGRIVNRKEESIVGSREGVKKGSSLCDNALQLHVNISSLLLHFVRPSPFIKFMNENTRKKIIFRQRNNVFCENFCNKFYELWKVGLDGW